LRSRATIVKVSVDWPARHQAWSDLRATRYHPPGLASADSERRRVYIAALQQAEEMFLAASEVGYASKPLLAFYGLSQAGRAIAAAHGYAREEAWQLSGHGLTHGGLKQPLPDIAIFQPPNSEAASFIRLSSMLNSPSLPVKKQSRARVSFNDLWDTLPEAAARPLRMGKDRRPALKFSYLDTGERHPLASGILCGIPPSVPDSATPRQAFDDFMKAYPTASGYDLVRAGADTDAPAYQSGSPICLQMHWRAGLEQATAVQREQRVAKVMTSYNGSLYLLPAVGGNDRPLHPLMAWWAVLYILSMLARYQPAEWVSHTNVDSGRYAVALEQLLTDALVTVPRLIYETIRTC
jgi:hypothetical protein